MTLVLSLNAKIIFLGGVKTSWITNNYMVFLFEEVYNPVGVPINRNTSKIKLLNQRLRDPINF